MAHDTTAPPAFALEVAERLAPSWERRREHIERVAGDVRRLMVDAADPHPGETVLELAAGTGDTGFDLVERIRPGGRLICSDISPAMLDAARRRGARRGIGDVEYRVVDAERIDLGEGTVDAVLCRMGYMLMPDPAGAFAEARRVLRPGGRLAMAVWAGPERNPFFTIPAAILVRRGHMPPPAPPPAPGIFALADAPRLEGLLRDAGFGTVRTEEVPVAFPLRDAADHVGMIADTAGPLALVVQALPDAERAAVTAEVAEALAPFAAAGGVHVVPGAMLVTAAR